MKKKTVILIVVLVACFLCLVCLGVSYFGITAFGNTITTETASIKSTSLDYLCSVGGDLLEGDDIYFTDEYVAAHTFADVQSEMGTLFPAGFDCANLLPNGGTDFIGILMKGQSVSISSVNGETSASISFKSKDGTRSFTIDYLKVDDEWLVSDIK